MGTDNFIKMLNEEFLSMQNDPVQYNRFNCILLSMYEQDGSKPKYLIEDKGLYKLA